jgi:ribose transport system substrate-binding protein
VPHVSRAETGDGHTTMDSVARRSLITLVVAFAVGVLAGGCGSSSSSSSSSSSGQATVAASTGSTTAQAFVTAHLKAPLQIPIATSLPSKPPTGKLVAFVATNTPTSILQGNAIKEAATDIGWKFTELNAGTTPDSVTSAWTQAVQLKPSVVIGDGTPRSQFESQLDQLHRMGVPYIGMAVTDPVGKGLAAVVVSPQDFVVRGQWLAYWVAAHSNGKANVLLPTVTNYPVLQTLKTAFDQKLTQLCPGCNSTPLSVNVSDIGTGIPGQIANYIRSHPNISWVVPSFGDLTLGVPEALAAAGVSSHVQMVSQTGGVQNFKNVANGTEAANVPEDEGLMGWLAMDAAIRAVEHAHINPASYAVLPRNYLDKANIGDPSKPYTAIAKYRAAFLRLWHVG